jgi:four helix bundle protein
MEHEKLKAYRQLLRVAEELAKRMRTWPRGHGELADQLRRAMASAVLTLAEGNGKRSSQAERRRFFEMSMGSIAEVSACLDLASIFGLIEPRATERLKGELKHGYYRIRRLGHPAIP